MGLHARAYRIHNYHMLLVPGFLRKKLPKAKIGLFIHTPFPTSDVFRALPVRQFFIAVVVVRCLLLLLLLLQRYYFRLLY